MNKLFNAQSLLSTFPESVAKDETLISLAQVTAKEFENLYNDNNLIMLYTRIDELDEKLLDILAYDFKIDWWDNEYNIDKKRAIFKSCWQSHRALGTVGALREILTASFGGGEIEEWFDYGGDPYHFKLRLPVDFGRKYISKETIENFYKLLDKIKNKRSKLDEFVIEAVVNHTINIGMTIISSPDRTCIDAVPQETKEIKKCAYLAMSLIEYGSTTTIDAVRTDKISGFNFD